MQPLHVTYSPSQQRETPEARVLILLGYLHPVECEHGEVHARVQAQSGLVSVKLVIG